MTNDEAKLRRLERFIGTWNTTGTFLDAEGGAAGVLWASDVYRWLPGRRVLIHDVDARMDGTPQRSLEVLTWDDARGSVVSRSFDDKGGVADFACRLEGEAWEIDGLDVRFRGGFEHDDRLAGTWELREESGWRRWLNIALERAA